MNKKVFTVSVGIPAYNEEANIKHLLEVILGQKEEDFILQEVIVVSDGSDDRTVAESRSVISEKVLVIDKKDRKGQAERQNDIVRLFKGDILVLLNADVLPTSTHFLREIIKPFYTDKNIGIVGGSIMPLKANNFFEDIVRCGALFKRSMYERVNGGDTVYLCHGAARAFSRAFTEKIHWPQAISEDAFSYYACKQNNFRFVYAEKAEVWYRCAQTFYDHMKQSIRFMGGVDDLAKRFPTEDIYGTHHLPVNLISYYAAKAFLRHPILFIGYTITYIVSKFLKQIGYYRPTATWEPSQSTKKLF